MITIKVVEFAVDCVILFMAYCLVVSIAGFFKAWAARLVGDRTAYEFGFMTFNPLAHIDFVGMVCLFLIRFGWGKFVPVNPFNISEPRKTPKIIFAFLADVLAYVLISIASMVALIAFWGFEPISKLLGYVVQGGLSLGVASIIFPNSPSIVVVLALVLFAAMYLSIALSVLNLLVSGFTLSRVIFLGSGRFVSRMENYSVFTQLFLPMILIFLLSGPLRIVLLYMIATIGQFIALMFGLS